MNFMFQQGGQQVQNGGFNGSPQQNNNNNTAVIIRTLFFFINNNNGNLRDTPSQEVDGMSRIFRVLGWIKTKTDKVWIK